MNKKVKISVIVLLVIIAIIALLHWQAKRIIIDLVQANTENRVAVSIGKLQILPHNSSISMKDVSVKVTDKDSGQHSTVSIRNVFLDVYSLWDFFIGGTLVIENLDCEGGEIVLSKNKKTQIDSTQHAHPNLGLLIDKLKVTSARFKIQEMYFRDFNLTMLNHDDQRSTKISHLHFAAHELYLSADSLLKNNVRVDFSLPHQSILLSSGIEITFDTLFFSTKDNSIQVDKLKLNLASNIGGNQFNIVSEKVRLAHFNFEKLYTQGVAVIDSVFLDSSIINMKWHQSKSAGKTQFGLDSVPGFNVKHLIINKLAASLEVKKDSIQNTYTIKNSTLYIDNFWHKPDSAHTVSTKNFDLVVTQYNTFLSKNNTSITFDTIRLQKTTLSLLNFKLVSEKQKLPILQTSVFKLNQVDWYAFVFDKKLIAKEAIVQNPIVNTTLGSANPSDSIPKHRVVLNALQDFIEVELFTLNNATANLRLIQQDADVLLRGFDVTLHFNDMLNSADNPNTALSTIENLNILLVKYKSSKLAVQADRFNLHRGTFSLDAISIKQNEKSAFLLNGLKIEGLDWNTSKNSLKVTSLGWKYLNVAIVQDSARAEPIDSKPMPSINIENIKGENTKIKYANGKLTFTTLLPSVNLDMLQIDNEIHFNKLRINGKYADIISENFTGSMHSFKFTDEGGELNTIRLNKNTADTIALSIEQINFAASIQALANRKYLVNRLALKNITTQFAIHDSLQQFRGQIDNSVWVDRIHWANDTLTVSALAVDAGPINLRLEKKVSTQDEKAGMQTKFNVRNVKSGFDSLLNRIDTINANQHKGIINQSLSTSENPLQNLNTTTVQSQHGGNRVLIQNIVATLHDSTIQFKAELKTVQLQEVQLNNNNLQAHISSGSLHDMVINSDHFNKPWEILRDNISTTAIRNLKVNLESNGNRIQFDQFEYDPMVKGGSVLNFEFRPQKDREEFLDDSFYQTNFMDVKIPSITFNTLNIKRLVDDSVIHMSSIRVSKPYLDIQRDKTHPFHSKGVKLLPTNALQNLGIKIQIDTLQLEDGKILYTEKSRMTSKEGSLEFTALNGLIRNIKSTDLGIQDSLYIRASTRFLDSAVVKLRVRESYHDTLAGFLMTTQVSPFHTSILNNALVPLVSVKFESGFIDTIRMRAVGREYLSLGSMKMFYHDLKIDFLNKNDTAKNSVKNVLLKFAANNFVIKGTNTNRIGKVYYERDRQRAVVQYWVKMILSGVTTSVGAKSNRKQIKKYQKELGQKKLPPIDEELNDL